MLRVRDNGNSRALDKNGFSAPWESIEADLLLADCNVTVTSVEDGIGTAVSNSGYVFFVDYGLMSSAKARIHLHSATS